MLVFFSGLVFFLTGLEGCKWSMKKIMSRRFKQLMLTLNHHVFLSIIIGVIITAILQSSSAVSIILIGLIEARAISLKPAICIMLGANIGTTFTAQIISLPILSYYPLLFIIGITLIIIANIINERKFIYLGITLIFFAIVFGGMVLMTGSFKSPDNRFIIGDILKFSDTNIYLGIFLGSIVTAIIQSSSALTGIIVSLALNNLITLQIAIAIALGSNIGTCITAFIASINAGDTSKTMARGHFIFNLIGILAILPFFSVFVKFITITSNELVRQIANAHTVFNIFNVLIFLPFIKLFINWISKDSEL